MRITRVLMLLVAAGPLLLSGCQSILPHKLHPSQLWKMNRQDPWDEGQFSIPDPVDPRLSPQSIPQD